MRRLSRDTRRAGFVTSALDAREDPLQIMKITRQVKVDTLKEYDRRENDSTVTPAGIGPRITIGRGGPQALRESR